MKILAAIIVLMFWNEAAYCQHHRSKSKHVDRERWDVKTLADGFRWVAPPISTTVAQQCRRNDTLPHWGTDSPRGLAEDTLYALTCEILEANLESDSDYHLRIRDLKDTQCEMVAEIPPPSSSTEYSTRFKAARDVIDRYYHGRKSRHLTHSGKVFTVTATIEGVGFWDHSHGRNAKKRKCWREIHPAVKIEVLDSKTE